MLFLAANCGQASLGGASGLSGNSLLHVLRSSIRLAASRREAGVQVTMFGVQILVLVFLFGLYWICMMADCHLIFVNVDYVYWSIECTILLFPHKKNFMGVIDHSLPTFC